MSPKQDRSRETETAIVRAAMKLATDRSSSEITIRDICAEAGVSVGAFYHHFSSRQELYHRSFENFDRELSQYMVYFKQQKPPLETLTELLLFQTSFSVREIGSAARYYFIAILSDTTHTYVDPSRLYYQSVHACVRRLAEANQLRADCAPDSIAELCILFVRGSLIDWCLHNQSYDVVDRVRSSLPVLYRGFLENPPN